jgi:hypothetical protein
MSWPFPAPGGPIPWSPEREKQYQQQRRAQWLGAPL